MEARTVVEGADALRHHLHTQWAAVAPAWGEHAAYADERGASAAARLLALAAPRPGERVLELACGPGGLGFAAAELVAPEGIVVLSDVVAEMTAIAAARAESIGLHNVRTRVLDLEDIDESDGSYDVVLCREGMMFAVDPARAAREMWRVLRPGGRLAIAVWGPRERNPWLGIVLDAVSAQLGMPMPPPGIPGPFSLGDPDRLTSILSATELTGVRMEELATPLRAASFEQWWTRTSSLAGPIARVIESLPETAQRELTARLRDAVAPYETPAGLEFPGVNLIAAARR